MLYPIELRARGAAGSGTYAGRAPDASPANYIPAMQHSPFPPLPCYPCPHQSSCCAYGTTLSAEEAREIRAHHGPDLVYRTRWGEWRTRVVRGRCGFLVNNACTLY